MTPAEQALARLRSLSFALVTLARIVNKKAKSVQFEPNAIQRWVIWNIEDQESLGLPVRLWILKGRQFGISTLFVIRCLLLSLLYGENCLLIAHKERPGVNMFMKAEKALEKMRGISVDGEVVWMPPERGAPKVKGSEMRFDTDCYGAELDSVFKRESAENDDPGVGETFQHIHLTEVPLWRGRQGEDRSHQIMGALLPTIPDEPGTTIVAEFTARGVGDYAHTTFQEARDGQSQFRALFLPWYWHEEYTVRLPDGSVDVERVRRELAARPFSSEERRYRQAVKAQGYAYPLTPTGRLKKVFEGQDMRLLATLCVGFDLTDAQLLWRRHRIRDYKGDVAMFDREYPWNPEVAFQAAGRKLIPPQVMDEMDLKRRPPLRKGDIVIRMVRGKLKSRFMERDDGELWQWERPVAGAEYLIDADPASGAGRDSCGAHVWKLEHRKATVVASYRGKMRPPQFARLLATLGRQYRTKAIQVRGEAKIDPTSGKESEIIPERNTFGDAVITELRERLFYGRGRIYRHEERNSDQKIIGHRYGFPTTSSTKMPMLQVFAGGCYDGVFEIPCERTLTELRNMVYLDDEDRTAGAPQGLHDDMGMSAAIGGWRALQKPTVKRTKLPKSVYDTPSELERAMAEGG